MGVCEEQRRLEEEEDLLLGTGSGESAADESELLRMDIDIEDDMSDQISSDKPEKVFTEDSSYISTNGNSTKSSGVGTKILGVNSPTIGNSTKPSGVGTETMVNSNGSGSNSGNSTKPSGVGLETLVTSKGSGSNSIPEGVSTGESNTRVSANTISVGTESSSNAQTSSVVGNPEVCQDGTYLLLSHQPLQKAIRNCAEPSGWCSVPLISHWISIQRQYWPAQALPHLLGLRQQDERHDQLQHQESGVWVLQRAHQDSREEGRVQACLQKDLCAN